MSAPAITRHGEDVLGELRALYLDMRDHHAAIAPHFGPIRGDDDAWARRMAGYRRHFADPDEGAFVLVARDGGGAPIGYAMVYAADGMPGWSEPGRLGVVETLTVVGGRRGEGIGKALLDAVYAELARGGIDTVALDVVASNTEARRFYEREGMTERTVRYWASRPAP